MVESDHDTDEEQSENTDPYADSEGEPVTCPKCGTNVALHYYPWENYREGGFRAHCACAFGPMLDGETLEGFLPDWFSIVAETEDDAERLINQYGNEKFDFSAALEAAGD